MKKFRNFASTKPYQPSIMTAVAIPATASAKTFAEYLQRSRRRCTPERFMILEAVETLQGHFTVKDVCARLTSAGQHVAPATVYSTIQYLVECSLVRRLHIDDGAVRYEVSPTSHHHLVCTRCGKIKDVHDTTLEEILRARRYSAFTPASFSLSVYGVCSACARKARQAEAKKQKPSKPVISSKAKK